MTKRKSKWRIKRSIIEGVKTAIEVAAITVASIVGMWLFVTITICLFG